MASDAELRFTDRAGSFYAREYGLAPITGRLAGFLAICDPPEQTIAELAEALLASRSAISGSVKALEDLRFARRTRRAGDRVDRVSLDPAGNDPRGFDSAIYREQAALAREGLALLREATPQRRTYLEEMAAFSDFLARRMPELLAEWHALREDLRARITRV